LHPWFNFSEAVGQGGVSCSGNGFSGCVIISTTVEVAALKTNKFIEREQDEQERTKY